MIGNFRDSKHERSQRRAGGRGLHAGRASLHRPRQPRQRIIDNGPRTAQVRAQETMPFGAEFLPFVEPDARAGQHEVLQCLRRQAKRTAVDPGKVKRVHLVHAQAPVRRVHGGGEMLLVCANVSQHGFQPGLALGIGRLGGHHAEQVDYVELVALELPDEGVTQPAVGNDQVCALQAGQVEGLAGRGARQAVRGEARVQGGKGKVPPRRRQDEVLVDLVGDHQDAVAQADLAHRAQVVFRPDVARGIVRIGEDEQPRVVTNGPLEDRRVEAIAAVFQDERRRRVALALGSTLPLTIYPAPFPIPPYSLEVYFHRRHAGVPGHAWLRDQMRLVLAAKP
uniref:Uncharacterized protein n=1 Tax=Ralstonia solanacearum TaxID=305 RepID=A0A0S4XC78_RALSL|nr:protein of unknown function [Ralstonia solanacearum]CUV38771.1 protein of unknown function [Ralstonia solanacearum]CUV61423.1 protein of unknown function [Ralstonia solanacearum]